MEKEEVSSSKSEMEQKMFQNYKHFMTRVTSLDESVAAGSGLLTGFQQSLEFLRKPPVNRKSELVEAIIKANDTKRMASYFESGCIHPHDAVQNMNKSKTVLEELEYLISDSGNVIETVKQCILLRCNNDADVGLEDQATSSSSEEEESASSSGLQMPKLTDYAIWMAIIYNMLKQDLEMQEKIVSVLGLELSSGELQTYSMMWSLRPFVNDELMHEAWKLIH